MKSQMLEPAIWRKSLVVVLHYEMSLFLFMGKIFESANNLLWKAAAKLQMWERII